MSRGNDGLCVGPEDWPLSCYECGRKCNGRYTTDLLNVAQAFSRPRERCSKKCLIDYASAKNGGIEVCIISSTASSATDGARGQAASISSGTTMPPRGDINSVSNESLAFSTYSGFSTTLPEREPQVDSAPGTDSDAPSEIRSDPEESTTNKVNVQIIIHHHRDRIHCVAGP